MTTDPESTTITAPDLRARSRAGDSPAELEAYLREHIPLAAAMDVTVDRADPEGVILSAPLEPNINHRDTVFGGSASALAILAGWALVHVRLSPMERHHRIVIQRNETEYLAPIHGRFRARAFAPDPDAWDRFLRTLKRRGKGRVHVDVELLEGEPDEAERVGSLAAQYVALNVAPAPGADET